MPASVFEEGQVEADGFRVRYLEAGRGEPLVVLHGGGGLRLSRSHEFLAESQRVVLMETPGFGKSPVNDRSASLPELALTMAEAAANLGLETFNLIGSSFGGKLALWLALQLPERVQALVLAAPAAMRPEAPSRLPLRPEDLYAHPERQPPAVPPDASVVAKQVALVERLIGPARDPELERRLAGLTVPVLVVFGTLDQAIPPEMGRLYREKLPNCHLILVYDAGHAVDADRPEAFASLVADFLARKEGFLVSARSGLLNP